LSTETGEKQLNELLGYTKALLFAANISDYDEIGRQLEKRRQCLDAITLVDGNDLKTEAGKALISEITLIDGKACCKIRELAKECSESLSEYKKKAVGLLKYGNSLYNLTSGQFYDKMD
jgi:hypothetical protein